MRANSVLFNAAPFPAEIETADGSQVAVKYGSFRSFCRADVLSDDMAPPPPPSHLQNDDEFDRPTPTDTATDGE